MNPATFKGYNFDCDGDEGNVHVPATENARKEVIDKMLPSKNLLFAKSFQPSMLPLNESALGLYNLSTSNNKNLPKKYTSEADVIADYNAGKLQEGDQVEIVNS